MKNTLKFRAWIEEHVDSAGQHQKARMTDEFDFTAFDGEYFIPEGVNLKYMNVMRDTGLKDSTGTPIYEGDVVQCRKRFAGTFSEPLVLTWCDTGFRLLTKNEFPYDFRDRKPFKALGNIYEHKHLL